MASNPVDFKTAFMFPFNKASRMWNILWVLLPIFGWFALAGYQVRIMNGFIDGKFKQLPKMTFKKDLKLGFWMVLKALPFVLAFMFLIMLIAMADETLAGTVEVFLVLFVVPVLGINFIKKQTVDSFFEVGLVKHVFNNFVDYVIALLKSLGLAAVFFIMMIILVGIPASTFTKNLFIADFYRRRVLKK